jgi:transcriptional regulator with XRE-family HTH domain
MTPIAKVISYNIRLLRLDPKLSQAMLAKRAKVSQATIAQIEMGRKTPSIATLAKLAKALKVEPWELLKPRDHAAKDTE